MKNEKYLHGPFAVILTPFNHDKVDEEGFVKQVKGLNKSDISGFVVNGSTAEFPFLSLDEQMRMADLVMQNKAKDKKVVVSACTCSAVDTLKLCKHAKTIGADAVLVCPPYYFKYSMAEREEYYTTVADNSPLPVILYNIPFFTQELELEVIFKLFKHKNVIGIKDSSANMKRLMHLISVTENTKTFIFTGTDDILYPAIFAGCAGSMTALAATFPDKICAIYKNMEEKNYEKAREIQLSLMETLRKADSLTFPKGYKKLLSEVLGINFSDKTV